MLIFLYYVAIIIIVGIAAFALGRFIKHKSLSPFLPFRYDFRKRRDTFLMVLKILDLIEAKTIIETGTSREGLKGAKSQGAASIVFGKWAKMNGAMLHSVDISPESVRVAQEEIDANKLNDHVKLYLSDSVEFLLNYKSQVDFLYLDSYDYSDDPDVQELSQLHHLNEFKAIESLLHHNTIVLIDDCDLPGGGKGKKVIEYMLSKNWFVHTEAYQVLLLHKDSSVLDKIS
jgi:predicted O-methyltransferase YrrM